jgi:hypothetical protein
MYVHQSMGAHNMSKLEMKRRLATIPGDRIREGLQMISAGYGSAGIQFETGLTVKQVNALVEWFSRYCTRSMLIFPVA